MRLTKRVLSVTLALCMVLIMLPVTAVVSHAEGSVSLTVGNAAAKEGGDTVTVDIVMDSGENLVNGWQFSLGYDTDALTYTGIVQCPDDKALSPMCFVSVEQSRYGHPLTIGCTFNLAENAGAAVSGRTVIAKVSFKVSETAAAKSYPITIENCQTGGNTFYLMGSSAKTTQYTPSYTNGSVVLGEKEGTVTLEASADKTTVEPGDTLQVTYTLKNPSELAIAGYEFHLDYADAFELVSLTIPEELGGKEAIGTTSTSTGLVANTLRDASSFTAASAVAAVASFRVKDTAEKGSYTMGASLAAAEDTIYGPLPEMEEITSSVLPCTVTVNPCEVPADFALQITSSNASPAKGEQFTAEFKLCSVPSTGFGGWDLALLFNSDVLEVVSAEIPEIGGTKVLGGITPANHVFGVIPGADGTGVTNWQSDAVIAKVTFRVLDSAPDNVTAEIGAEFEDLFYASSASPYERDLPAPKVEKASVKIGEGSMETVLLGDADKDGKVNSTDRTVLARYLAGWSDYPDSKVDLKAADVNGDGKVNSTDRTVLARHLAGWSGYEQLPYKG